MEAGIVYREVNYNLLEEKQNTDFLSLFLQKKLTGCTAVVCYNDEIAYYIIRELKFSRKEATMRKESYFTKRIADSKNFTVDVSDSGEFTINIQDAQQFTINITDCKAYSINEQDSENQLEKSAGAVNIVRAGWSE